MSKSFTRLDSPHASPISRSRASTLQNGTLPGSLNTETIALPLEGNAKRGLQENDIFEKDNLISGTQGSVQDVNELDSTQGIPDGFDELPIELISLIDRFIESLTAKVHNTPPSIEKLSDIFQSFYVKAESHIATHISALSTRQSRVASPNPSISSKASSITKDSNRLRASSKDTLGSPVVAGPEQQMLTPQEISERRKTRRMLDRKRIALEEAVEKVVCEKVYSRIWRHRSTLDEVRDEKLRSRTAALALVGINLQDLGITFDTSQTEEGNNGVEDWILKARDGLLRMNEAKYPLGKLQQLAATHKNIVDLLTTLHQSSSSADEILPTLIYTLIRTPPEGINVISNLHFIQRFRATSKVDGEAAYCLVNLEAAITFLETVDLASLRSDEPLEGPAKSTSRPTTPQKETRPDWSPGRPKSASVSSLSAPPLTAHSPVGSQQPMFDHPLQPAENTKTSTPTPPSHHRKLSNLFQPPAGTFGAAGDAVRLTADQGIKTISNALDGSFKLLFGRLKEQQVAGEGVEANGTIIVPKTLDDARKLVEPKAEEEEEVNTIPIRPLFDRPDEETASNSKPEDNLLAAFTGRKQSRDRSVDSVQSSGSSKRNSNIFAKAVSPSPSQPPAPVEASPYAANAAVESMRSLGNAINPLKGFAGMSGLRGFGRSSSSGPTSAPTATPSLEKPKELSQESPSGSNGGSVTAKIAPPTQRYLDVATPEELKIGEVADLLTDYKRLAAALKDIGAF
ncbi:hypothetical protein JMJ35_009125 [Cladonia borealis]|uniref:VPS9 domain-containing protein n=1 Tax=Cladonia borealis TaxID=184061 RepID=A0AA39QVT5_9LECA|nr:hypothetical protein JMJ35_009125 [Cladonia borealis]